MVKNDASEFDNTLKRAGASMNFEVHKIGLSSHLQSPWIRAAKLPELFCSWDLAYRCTRSGWLKPIIQGKRRTIYRLADVLRCMQRIEAGEVPSARPKRVGR